MRAFGQSDGSLYGAVQAGGFARSSLDARCVQRLPGVGYASSALDDRWLVLLVLFGCRGYECGGGCLHRPNPAVKRDAAKARRPLPLR